MRFRIIIVLLLAAVLWLCWAMTAEKEQQTPQPAAPVNSEDRF